MSGLRKGYGEYLQQSAGLLSDGQRGSKHISSALPGMVKENFNLNRSTDYVCWLGCPYTTYYGDCSYKEKGCYIEEKEKAANVSKETRKVLSSYVKTIKTMYDDLSMYQKEEELSDVNGDKKDKTELMRDAWLSLYEAAEALEKALA